MAANLEPGFFRLILLSPGQWDDEIRCTLIPFNRFRDTYPPYKALSYVWGRWSRTPPKIRVNGRNVKVTTNLAVALRHLRHGEVDMALWIDALCIDQSNTEERSSQVAQMRDIYSTAVEVIMFLGSGLDYGVSSNHHSSRDLRPLHIFDGGKPDFLLASQYIDAWKTSPLKKPVQALEVFAFLTIMSWSKNSLNPLGVLEDIPEAHMAALAEALRRTLLAPWWDRIWVVQEAVVANRLTVRYGNVTVPWKLLVGAAEVLSGWESIYTKNPGSLSTTDLKVFNLSSRILNLDNFRTQWFQSRGTNLLLLLRYFGSRRASDERDRVYALVGLCNEATIFRPDYSLQVAEVYMAPVIVAIRNTGSLHVLMGDHSRKGRQDIPSWVPDWSAEREELERQRIELSTLYDACKGIKVLLTTENDSVLNSIRDDLDSLLGRLKAEQDPERLLKEEYAPVLRDLSSTRFTHSPFDRLEIGPICAELAMYCHQYGRRELPKYSIIVHNGRSLRIVGRRIGTVSKTTEPLYESPNANTAVKMLGEWAKVARARPVGCEDDNFVRTIFSDIMKNPNGSLERLQWDGGFVPGGDPMETLIQISEDYDQFSDVVRISTTKRAMFFINDVDKFYSESIKSLDEQELLLAESEKVLDQSFEKEAHMDLLRQHKRIIDEAKLLQHSEFLKLREDIMRNEAESLAKFFKHAEMLLDNRSAHFYLGLSTQEDEGVLYERDIGKHGKSTQLQYHRKEEFREEQQDMIDEHRRLLRRQRDIIIQSEQLFNKSIEKHRLQREDSYYCDKSFFAKYGHMGMGPMLMKEGDEVYILPGSRVPLVLRLESCCENRTCSHSIRRYRLIGDCFVQGAMDDELGLNGLGILTIDDEPSGRNLWKTQVDRCKHRGYIDSHIPAGVGSLVALEII
ncbi:hypothetical protein BBK36DRAFT_1121167 [Trichoderma citrinoviride]|uniref:Heterokaryon incompatibility domain-containing protein n=1 Tax=Trichoderma citrinoviride TaxID=58853 RepID=A0A2T4B8R8_9HYPO|nr:hypothetical protein BBK36DRAFT_1121167 [Trichoderma citrinoviride]PTB65723.1 hypothetical protein BBK36DRAFT_1121167 [Trichoderma citrinoviride]